MCISNGIEEDNKITITLVFNGNETKVSWNPLETSLKEAKFMFLCTCDSLIDGQFELYDSNGQLINLSIIEHFDNNSTFFLHKANGIINSTITPSNLLLDNKRMLYVEIKPLNHIEVQKAIKYLSAGTNILKQTKKGVPHIKLFQLSADLKRILWYSKSKKITESQLAIESIKDITLGQISDLFIEFPIKSLEEFSFSIYYYKAKDKKKDVYTLDLICKDEREFDIWLIAIKALHSHYNAKIISKHDLLSHSLTYQKQIEKGNISNCSTFLFDSDNKYTPKGKCLQRILLKRDQSLYSVTKRIYNLCHRDLLLLEQIIKKLSEREINRTTTCNGNGKENYTKTPNEDNNTIEGYQEIQDEEIVDDIETQKNQIEVLYTKNKYSLAIAIDDLFLWYDLNKNNTQAYVSERKLLDFNNTLISINTHFKYYLPYKDLKNETIKEKIESDNFLKELDMYIWEIEVNFNNLNEIKEQINSNNDSWLVSKIKKLFK